MNQQLAKKIQESSDHTGTQIRPVKPFEVTSTPGNTGSPHEASGLSFSFLRFDALDAAGMVLLCLIAISLVYLAILL